MVEVEVGIDDESNLGDPVAVRLECGFDWVVHDLVVVIEHLVALTDPGFVQDHARWVAHCEREDLACLPAERMPLRERDVSEVERDDILERKPRHLANATPTASAMRSPRPERLPY